MSYFIVNIVTQINFDTENKNWRLFEQRIANWLRQSINFCDFLPDCCVSTELNVHLIKNYKIKRLNSQYRRKNKVTNVLSFPYVKFEQGKFTDELRLSHLFLGEMFIAIDLLLTEARMQNLIWQHHLQHLVVHSLLHMLGFDHTTDEGFEIMCKWEEKMMENMNKLIKS